MPNNHWRYEFNIDDKTGVIITIITPCSVQCGRDICIVVDSYGDITVDAPNHIYYQTTTDGYEHPVVFLRFNDHNVPFLEILGYSIGVDHHWH